MNLDILRERAKIVSSVRRFFDELDFVEVETAVRIPAPAPEEHIDCPPVVGGGYLRASPEIQMKKLLAAGMDRIYQIGPCFREGEKGSRHNPEFTMIEWYRRKAGYLDIMEDLEKLLGRLFAGKREEGRGKREEVFRRLTVRDAYLKCAGWDPWLGDWDQDRFDFDMATKIEPALKELGGGIFLMDYPPQAASLSKISLSRSSCSRFPDSWSQFPVPCPHPVAERWEFYYNGMELANCFTELCDTDEQRKRFLLAKETRKALGESDYPIDEGFLACLPQIESASGVALGIDRLVMVLTKVKEISAVRTEI